MKTTKRSATKTLCLGAIALSFFAACRVDKNGFAPGASANTPDPGSSVVPENQTPDPGNAGSGGTPETTSPADAGAVPDGLAPAGGIQAGGNSGGTGGSLGSAAGNAPATGGRGGMPNTGTTTGGAGSAAPAGGRTAQAGDTAGHAGSPAGGTGGQGGSGSSLGGSSTGNGSSTGGAGGNPGAGGSEGGSAGPAGAGGSANPSTGRPGESDCEDDPDRKPGSESSAEGVLAYYPCEPTANPNALPDFSKHCGPAMLISDPRPPLAPWFGPGKVGGAVVLDPVSRSYVRLPSGLLSHAREATVASWVYIAHSVANQRIFDFGENTDVYMFLTSKHFGSGHLCFAITQRGPSSNGEQFIDGPKELPAGEWSHVAVVLGAGGGILYVNGVQVAANPGVVLRPKDLGTLSNGFVGRSQFPNDPYFDGSIDEFRVYDRALTASEIKQLATAPSLHSP